MQENAAHINMLESQPDAKPIPVMPANTAMNTALEINNALETSPGRPLPGDLAVWCLILLEISTFAAMFLAFSWMRNHDRALFLAGQAELHPVAGLINTLTLLTASGFVAQSVVDSRSQRQARSVFLLLAAIASALVYVVVKLWEYWQLGSAGYGLHGDHFFIAYFLSTGFHLLHVLLGIGILAIMAKKASRGGYGPDHMLGLESGAMYWHMVDLIWIVLFPIVYVIQ